MCSAPLLLLLVLGQPSGPPADPDFNAIVAAVGERSRSQSCAAMEQWLSGHPGALDAPRGLLWMARLRLLDEQPDLARPLLERALALGRGTSWEPAATKELADLDAQAHHFGKAIAAYDHLARGGDDFWSAVGKASAIEARAERVRWLAFCGLFGLLVLIGGSRLVLAVRARAKPWRIPREAIVFAPFTALLVAGALTQEKAEAVAISEIALGGFVLLWIGGVTLRGRRLSAGRRVGEILLGLVQTAALGYCCLAGNHLWVKLLDTVLHGASE
jgi:hypothetical protein